MNLERARGIAPFHWLTIFFLFGLIGVTLLSRGQVPLWRSLLSRYALCIALVLGLKLLSDRKIMGKASAFLHDFSPIIFVIFIYQSLGDLIQYLWADIDVWLIKIDFSIFGTHPTVWMEKWVVPWLTDLMSFAYGSYYFLPVILIATLYLKGRRPEFTASMFVLTFAYYVSFTGYILFPAVGPRYTLAHLYSMPLGGSFLTDLVRDGLNALEHNKRDVMPSGHTQIALIVLYLAHRYERFLFYVFVPIVCGLILSTVYLRYHYVIDILAGSAIALVCIVIGPRLYRWWNVRNSGDQVANIGW
ncbi:MAG: phosphatase PAP2 family protein [Syntrophaceae bacterium]|nr:phosphatase PAP2 family protein [Syntrophaceae bacterium]